MREKINTDISSIRGVSALRLALWVGFGIAALLTAYLTYNAVRDFTTSWEMTNLPGMTIQEATPIAGGAGNLEGTQTVRPESPEAIVPTPPPWDGANRVSILVMGLDYRDWLAGEGPPRTDTMILFTIDPINRTAGMLSIPRDLWVNIPGFNYGRINTAYQLGELYNYPGGGPQLAVETVEELLGVPIQYYAQIDFSAFVRFIDEIGGVKLEVTEEVKIDPIQGKPKKIKPGRYTFSGDLLLAYVRARKTEGGDFDRANRQQQVILAIRDRILEFNMLPTLISKAPVLYEELSSGIRTNLPLEDAIKLAWLASQIPEENIKRGAIGADQVSFARSPDGTQDVLKPITEKIRLLRDEIFTLSGPASPMAINMDQMEVLHAENARVAVLNGSYTAGLAARTSDYLRSLGINVTQTGNADQASVYTILTFYTGKPYTVKFLVDLFKISEFRIHHLFDPLAQVDIVLILGDDWAQNNPMP